MDQEDFKHGAAISAAMSLDIVDQELVDAMVAYYAASLELTHLCMGKGFDGDQSIGRVVGIAAVAAKTVIHGS